MDWSTIAGWFQGQNLYGLGLVAAALFLLLPDLRKFGGKSLDYLRSYLPNGGGGDQEVSPEAAFAAARVLVEYFRDHGCPDGMNASLQAARHILEAGCPHEDDEYEPANPIR